MLKSIIVNTDKDLSITSDNMVDHGANDKHSQIHKIKIQYFYFPFKCLLFSLSEF